MPQMPFSTSGHEYLALGEGASCLAALLRIGRPYDRTVGSDKIMKRDGWPEFPFSFRDAQGLGPAILAKVGKSTGLQPRDL